MSDSDDMEYPPLKRVNSTKDYEKAPHNLEFELRFNPFLKKKSRLLYTLKKNQILPYSTDLEGFTSFLIVSFYKVFCNLKVSELHLVEI